MMNIQEKTITEVIDGGYHEYAMYVLELRAIPSVIDGLKPVTRKLLYSMLNTHHWKRTKVSDLGGISSLNFHHGEASAIAAAIGMAQPWGNNAPIFEAHGNFGTRLVQEASGARYIYASLSENYKKFFVDDVVAPPAFDKENPEPAFYLPVIPWVLINGIGGMAVGFKTEVLPRSVKDVMIATKSYLKNAKKFLQDNEPVAPTFPHFKGKVLPYTENQWKTQGIIEYIGKYTFKISELPIGYDRESYITFLNELCDKDLIKDYEDSCSKDGFGFNIKVTVNQKDQIEKDPFKYFKLEKIHTEILTTLGTDGKLKIFKSVAELIAYFCQYRLKMFQVKIDYDKDKLSIELCVLKDKIKFINEVVTEQIDFRKTSKVELLEYIFKRITEAEHGKRFINIPLYECTNDAIKELENKVIELNDKLDQISKSTPEKMFSDKLSAIKI